MAITRLERKLRRKRAKQNAKIKNLKRQNFQPVIKSVDIDAMKKEFEELAKKGSAKKAAPKKKAEKKEEPKAEAPVAEETKAE